MADKKGGGRAVRIAPSPSGAVVIKGENGAGKSSVLDSIAYALGGEKLCPPQVIRKGARSATVRVDVGDLVVTRKWTAGGSRLEVVGTKYQSPQAILDRLVGSLSFDPWRSRGRSRAISWTRSDASSGRGRDRRSGLDRARRHGRSGGRRDRERGGPRG